MDQHTLNILEYKRLLGILSDLAASGPGAEYCLNLTPSLSMSEAEENWRLLDEAKEVLGISGRPPLDDLVEVWGLVSRLDVEGVVLRPLELLDIKRVVRASRLVRNHILAQEKRLLWELCEPLPVFIELERACERAISPEGEVLDTASETLARVRRELSTLRGAIQTKMTDLMRRKEVRGFLQDEIITHRGERYVIPVRSSSQRNVPGLVHDYSSSGSTAFVEPLEMVEDNNRLNYLRRKEQQEVEKVLARLSVMAAGQAREIGLAADILARVDGVFASAALSRQLKACAPMIDPVRGLDLRQARHPLLLAREEETGRKTTPIDLRMPPSERVIVISGINAGGKTVALKTLGLLVLMARAGLHLPVAEGSTMVYFQRIMASIGDEQDMQSDLSTFSGHVHRLGSILKESTDDSLVLLDELGTGTDPAEGAALALAILDELLRRGTWVMTATHYHMLKAWAQLTDGAGNAAVRTDGNGSPLYGLDYGTPGFSAGLMMARDFGLDPDLVARAESYLDDGHKQTINLIQRLEEERAALNESRLSCEALEEELKAACSRAVVTERKREEAHLKQIGTLKARVEKRLAAAENEFKALKEELKASARTGAVTSRFNRIKKDLREMVPAPPRRGEALEEANPGDLVLVNSLSREGRVASVTSDGGKVVVDVQGMTVKTTLDDLTATDRKSTRTSRGPRVYFHSPDSVPTEINLLGLTVDEALPEVEKSLDQALLGGVKHFYIIHGIGTGRLRQAVRGYLKGDARVKEFHRGAPRAGGEGVTVVELNV
jgi:DNA mismatch repair protein MutS2